MSAGSSDGLDAIRGMTSALISSIGSEELFQAIVDNARAISGARYVSLALFNEEKGTSKLAALSGVDAGLMGKIARLLRMQSLLQQELPVSKSASFRRFLRKRQRKPIVLKDFHDYTFGMFSKRTCWLVEKIVGVKEIVVIPLLKDKKFEGILGFLYSSKAERDFAPLLIFSDFALEAIEKSRTFTQLHDTEERFKELADSIANVFFAMDKKLRYTYWNKASEELTGIPARDAIGKSILEIFPDTEEIRKAVKIYRAALRTGKPQNFVNGTHLGDRDVFFEIAAYPTKDGLSVIAKDITERRNAEEKLRASESLYRTLAETMNEGLNATDKEGRYTFVNDKFCEMLGYSKAELLGRRLTDFISGKSLNEVEKYLGQRAGGARFTHEIIRVRKDGRKIFTITSTAPILDSAGAFAGGIAVVTDITEHRRAEEERLWKSLVEMWSETLTGEIIRAYHIRALPEELGLPQLLEQLANLGTVPSPSILFKTTVGGMRRVLSGKGIDTNEEQIRKTLAPLLRKFLRGIFGIARQFNRDIPKEYIKFEAELK